MRMPVSPNARTGSLWVLAWFPSHSVGSLFSLFTFNDHFSYPTSLPPRRFFPSLQAGSPSRARLWITIEAGDIWFNVNQRRPIKNIDAAHAQDIPLTAQQPHHGKPEAVGAAGVAGGKNAVRFVVEEGRAGKDNLSGAVEVVDEEQMGKCLDILICEKC